VSRRMLSSTFGQFNAGVQLDMNFVDPLSNVKSSPSGRSSQHTGRGAREFTGYTLIPQRSTLEGLNAEPHCSHFKLGHYL
jgi:hypothetical protein